MSSTISPRDGAAKHARCHSDNLLEYPAKMALIRKACTKRDVCKPRVEFACQDLSKPEAQLKLTPPEGGNIPVAIAITAGATVIDFAGPWEVFQDVMFGIGANHRMPFQLFTVSDTLDPVVCSAGIKILPEHTC